MGDSESTAGEAVYSDNLVEIRGDSITFRDYYLPYGDKTMPLPEIEGVYWWVPAWWSGKYRFWGTGDLRTWCPKDYRRHRRDRMFLITKKDRWTRIGFTVENPGRMTEVLGGLGLTVLPLADLKKAEGRAQTDDTTRGS